MRKRKASNLSTTDSQHAVNGAKHEISYRHGKGRLINDANALPTPQFRTLYIDDETLDYCIEADSTVKAFQIDFKSSSQLTDDEFKACFNLIASTSRQDYKASSWGWHPKRKKREMQEDEMRYLLVRSLQRNGQSGNRTNDPLQGLLSFMLTHDSTPSVPVLYIYEIHLSKPLRNLRLGAHLMEIVEGIAEKVGVEKLMLTCFLSNESAHGFYERRGYSTDVCSPEDRTTSAKTLKADYIIMSKIVPKVLLGKG